MKYIVPTKSIGLRKSIQKKYNIVMVNEFKTSKLCSKCEKPLENYRGLHRVLVCRDYKCNGCESKRITFINRDMNACMNMINISKSFILVYSSGFNPCFSTIELVIFILINLTNL